MLCGVVSAPAGLSPQQNYSVPPANYRLDPRYAAIRHFFEKTGCPASEYALEFVEAADLNALDWRLLPSISYVESTGGKAGRHSNYFGWDSGRTRFPSPEAAIYAVGYRLAHSELYRDKTLDEILTTYNPDVAYRRKVKSVMRRMAAIQ